ncbi:hypothetical protein NHX12_018534 [Muraenolepis orangiensis]|uniref:Reverse transcriptase domain-containing protein n=1 Tax=Muraenolepis orangiensis TaxID=630683 RepID=A0A9Q0IY34_9TELE|nr:hypothetical protein NHX12_018534 [Muraenolepis orangiensis]
MSELQLKEVREVVRKARASSAPGPSGTSYKMYKYCPKLLLRLWYILRVFWRRGRIPDQWRVAEGVWIPKEENSTQLDQFRIISLLCVEAKVFFSAVSKRLCTYLAENTYIDTSVQKGGISGMPGCLEHTGVVTQFIREARENKGNLSVLWLDMENAFGSIPHKLVQFTLTKHHVPSRCRDLIADYYSNFRMRVSSGAITSSWHKVEIGIITGCTISVTLFSLAMNMLTKSAEPECRGPRTNSGQRQPPIRAFMDDLTVMTESVPGCRWILKGLEELVEWARMRFKPAKSRSMVLRKGKVVDKFRFNIADTAIPSISEKPVKSLGKVFDCSLRDTTSIQSTCTELDGWLKSVDKSGLPGKFKAWVYQHGILPRILWPLLVYAVPISTVETLERRLRRFTVEMKGDFHGKELESEVVEIPSSRKKPNFKAIFKLLLLLSLIMTSVSYLLSVNTVKLSESLPKNLQYNRYFNGANKIHRAPLYRVDPNQPSIKYHLAYPSNYHFILDDTEVCRSNTPYVVLVVPVAPGNRKARDAIRKTWGNETLVQGELIQTVFLLGLPSHGNITALQEGVSEENLQYHDLIQSDFIDSYINLTIKTMVIMDWLATRCPKASYAMKIDSDTFLNVENLVRMLKAPGIPKKEYLTGRLKWKTPVIRKKSNKWYVPEEIYPEPFFPIYAAGMGYVFSIDMTKRLVEGSKWVSPLYVEDAYIGLCMKMLGLKFTHPPNLNDFVSFLTYYNRCTYSRIIANILASSEQLVTCWRDVKKPGPPC